VEALANSGVKGNRGTCPQPLFHSLDYFYLFIFLKIISGPFLYDRGPRTVGCPPGALFFLWGGGDELFV
jgi:hypothetical protein